MRVLPFVVVALAVHTAPALADEQLLPTEEVELSARTGSFLPFTGSPAVPASTVRTFGLYDGATNRGSLTLDARALLATWLQLQAAATHVDGDVSSSATIQLGLLQDEKHGLDLLVAAGYTETGLNTVPAVLASISAGHELPGLYLIGGARFELGTEQSERALALNVATVRSLSPTISVGLDSELTLDLERDASEPMGESSHSLHVGPVVTYSVSRVAVSAGWGVALDKPRMSSSEVGAYGLVGVGTAF